MSIRGETLSRHHVAFEATMGPIDFQLVEVQFQKLATTLTFVENSQFHLVRSSYVLYMAYFA